MSAPPYEDKFSHKIKIRSKDDSDSDSVSDEGGQEDALAHQVLGTRDFLLLLRIPYRLLCRQLIVKEKVQLVLGFTLCLRDQTLTTLACRFYEKIPFKTLKKVKQACTMYGCTAPFTLGLLQSVVGDIAMPPDN
jgi:hypothetical protein